MVVAPELFTPSRALECLKKADDILRGPTGMRTLDPSDENYRPYYINSDDSGDFHVAKGRNYHQGPEWLWCTGFFLRALLKFDLQRRTDKAGRIETLQQLHARLYNHRIMIQESPWAGLVELTNKDGGNQIFFFSFFSFFFCAEDSCLSRRLRFPGLEYGDFAWYLLFCILVADSKDLMHDTTGLEL